MLSIIMPVKNTACYLEACLDSIVHQTFTDWELIAVDDHSIDNSLEILKQYQVKDERLTVINNKGEGIVDALQTGYKQAQGDFITRMDSDDINELNKYELMFAQLKKKGEGHIALGQVRYFSEGGVQDGYEKYQNWLNRLIESGNCFEEIYKECVVPSPCWMLYRSDFERIGGFNSAITPEDYDLSFRMYKHDLVPIASDEVLFNWRDYPERTSRTSAAYKEEELLKIKCHHFLHIDFDKSKNLILWGAGGRGKFIANYLVSKEVPFTWVCNNEKKIGKEIYGVVLQSEQIINDIENKQIVVSVSNAEEQNEIREICSLRNWPVYYFLLMHFA